MSQPSRIPTDPSKPPDWHEMEAKYIEQIETLTEMANVDREIAQERIYELEFQMMCFNEREQKYKQQIKIFEEQIDDNQGAQEMVEKLTQQKTELEDKLREVIDDMDNMEKLRDLNEQLLENARLNEVELIGQLDKMLVQYHELDKKKQDLENYVLEQEKTLSKLKEENGNLGEQVLRLRDQFKDGESIEQQKHQIENVAYKLNFSETKMAEKESEISSYKRKLVEVQEQMNNLSEITKEQSNQIDELKTQLDFRKSENSELQRALKKKMEEVSELEIRREMAEKKMQSLCRDTEIKFANLNRTIEMMKGIEVQHEEEIKRLMEDNELIERERRELRDQLNKSNRSFERSVHTGNLSSSMVTAHDTSLASLGITYSTVPSNQGSPLQGSILQQQQSQTSSPCLASGGSGNNASISSIGMDDNSFIGRLKGLGAVFDAVNKHNLRLEMQLAMQELGERTPPYNRTSNLMAESYDMNQVKKLQSEALKLKREIRASIINQQICPKAHQIQSKLRSDKFNNSKLAMRYQSLENQITGLMSFIIT